MSPRRLSKIQGTGDDRRHASSRRARCERPRLECLESRELLSGTYVPGSVSGEGTMLRQQDFFDASTIGTVVGGVASYSGKLTFADKVAGDTFVATSITSVQVNEATPVVGPTKINGGFTILGTATLNGGTSAAYTFEANGSLPFPANTGSTGGLAFQVTGPNGFSYNTPWKPWDPGETVSMSVAQPVQIATTTHLTASANPTVYGQPVYFTATVTPASGGPAVGSVSFAVDSNAPVIEPVVNGVATYGTSSLAVGTHKVVATYLGTSAYAPSMDSIGSMVTKQATTTTTLSYSGTVAVGLPLSLTATVAVQSPSYEHPTGIVTFLDSGKSLGTVTLSGTSSTAVATLSLPTGLAAGVHQITAVYSGDANTVGSTSAVLIRTVGQLSTTTALTASINPVLAGQTFTLSATVAGPVSGFLPTGTVTFYEGITKLGTATVGAGGIASVTTSFTLTGLHSLQALYSGDTTFLGSSGTLTEAVYSKTAPLTARVSLSASANPIVTGQPVIFSVYVSPNGAPISAMSGTVTLTDGTKTLGTATLLNAQATFTIPTLSAGSHTITASYSGNTFFAPASASLTETVTAFVPGTVVGKGSSLAGQDKLSLNVAGALTAGVPTYSGSLTYSDSVAGDTFTATSITSVQIYEFPPVVGPDSTNGYFVVTGTATLNGGTELYTFTATGSLPFPADTGSTGGLEFSASRPNGTSYSAPWRPWDPGETIVMTE